MKSMNDRALPEMKLDGNLQENWRKWRQRFENYIVAVELVKKPESIQIATLLHYIGEESHEIFNTFNLTTEDKSNIKKVLESFEKYFNPKKNVTFERHKFFMRNQSEHESIDQYVTELKYRASTCEFGNLKESLIKDKLVCGINNQDVREKLLQELDLDLNKAITICRAAETSKQQSQTIAAGTSSNELVNRQDDAVHHIRKQGRKNIYTRGKQDNTNNSKFPLSKKQSICHKCGKSHPYGKCPAFGIKCFKCKQINHFSNCCKRKDIHTVDILDVNDDHELFIGSVNSDIVKKEWTTILKLNNIDVTFKLDTGAQVNCLPINILKKLKLSPHLLSKTEIKLKNYSGQLLNILGTCFIKCQYKNSENVLEFYVVDEKAPAVLGLPDCEKLNLIMKIETIETKNKNKIIDRYRDVFEGLGCVKIKPIKIKLNTDVKPVIHASRKVPFAVMNELKNELENLVQKNVIARVTEPTEWVNSLVIVRKPNGTLKICIDPKDLNKAINREHYHLPTLNEILVKLNGAKFFSILDASQGFWQLKLDYHSSKLCTFNTPFGRYRYLRLPFGIRSAPEIFHRTIQLIIENLEGVDAYLDDILIWGKTEKEHDDRLQATLDRLLKYNLKLNKDKSKFCLKEIKYLGHIISEKGIQPDAEKICAIKNMKKPNDVKSLQRFLGMITYVGQFIENLSDISAPLRDLLKKNNSWNWDFAQEKAYNDLIDKLINPPVLCFFDPLKQITISVDASSNGVGAVLMQEKRPIAYASKALTDTQKNWAQIEKEMYAIVFGCEKFYQYTYGRKINIETDHKPLISIFNKSLILCPLRLQRMLLKLQTFDINLIYKPGRELYVADTLSRAYQETTLDKNSLNDIDIEAHVCLLIKSLNITNNQLLRFQKETNLDPELQVLIKYTKEGWPSNNLVNDVV